MADPITIVISLPPVALNPHAKGSRWPKSKATKAHREEAATMARATRAAHRLPAPTFARATVTATYYCAPRLADKRYRPLDSTNANAALKAAVDGLVDAGIVPADDHRTLRMMPAVLLRTKAEHKGRAEVVLTIEEWAVESGEEVK